MHSGRPQPQAWSNFATAFPQGDCAQLDDDSHSSINGHHSSQIGPKRLLDEELSEAFGVDKEQHISAALVESDRSRLVSQSPPPCSPIPPSVAQANDISSSPAAMFLSAFMGSPATSAPEPLPDDEGQTVAGYTLGKIVGFGGFSTIRKAVSETGSVVAVKIIRRSDLVRTGHAPEERKRLQHEATIWSSLSHEHVLPLFSVVHTSYADYFITPYCPAGSLYDILKRDGHPALPQDDAGMMFRQVVRGLRYLHEDAMLVHRDMKLENVLVDEMGVCRIGDFGLSVFIGDVEDEETLLVDQHEHPDEGGLGSALSRHNSTRNRNAPATSHVFQPGSLPYAAPELLLPHAFEKNAASPGQDIWALGVMLYTLLTGRLPFNDPFEPRLQMKILNGTFEVPKDIGKGAEHVLHGCMERNVAKRWSIAMVDEVAWGVGWGSAGDLATPEASQENLLEKDCSAPMSAPSHPLEISIPEDDEDDWQKEEHVPRSAIEAASRRSRSRVQRSLSRAPLGHRNPSAHAGLHRSRPTSPTRSASLLYPAYPSRCQSPLESPVYETHDSRSRSQSRHRGRRPTKTSYFPSRSPSPSVVPSTPVDIDHRLANLNLRDPSEVLDLDSPPRGRTRFLVNSETFDEDEADEDPDDIVGLSSKHRDEVIERAFAGWTGPLDHSSRSREHSTSRSVSRHNTSRSGDASSFLRKSRPGSNPPTLAPNGKSWELYRNKASHSLSRNGSQDLFTGTFTPVGNATSRGRTVDMMAEQPGPATMKVEIPASS